MKFESVKKAEQVKLEGIAVDIEFRDNYPHAITLTDKAGNTVKVAKQDYSMSILVPAAPKMIEKHQLSGTIAGVPVKELFDYDYKAESRLSEIQKELGYPENLDLKITKVEVEEEE